MNVEGDSNLKNLKKNMSEQLCLASQSKFNLILLPGSFDQSPNLCDVYSSWAESTVAKQPRGSEEFDEKMKENLAEAMLESPMKEGGPSCISHGMY